MAHLSRMRLATSYPVPPRLNRSLIRPAFSSPASVMERAAANPGDCRSARAAGSTSAHSV
ncbi:hypothetical protein [Streptomyces sp. NBC_00576]|uniref:hypothetical protein n=1 Tax=Streptomyces sp. NBC_00576 TaxID=2903665 RepID=UPI002E81E87A|nr:hypothetical protein [Streptomyces sp. NBC_00576]WUB73473.1 hypothetical protein OG734_27230 [Streptomyces sp. NBC_00576]